jgi:hypothetical protein
LGDQAAYRHARKLVEQGQHSLPNGAADIFEINVDPIRTGSCELFGKVRCAMIDSGVEAKFFEKQAAFFGAAQTIRGAEHLRQYGRNETENDAAGLCLPKFIRR